MRNEKEKWHWQKAGTAWKGIGIYHVTMVIPSREPLLGKLVMPENDPTQARVERTELGNSLFLELLHLPTFYPEIQILQYCLMPDHLHAVIYVRQQMKKSIRIVARGFWQGAKKLGRTYTPLIESELNSGKINGEVPPNKRCLNDAIFTEMPFIRPMSRRGQLKAMIRYVQMNPQRFATKRLHPGFFRVQHNIEIAGRTYDAVGNIAILTETRRATVHVRRAMVAAAEHGKEQPLRDYMNGCVIAARENTVMVSPFISQKEKEVLMVLIKEQHQVIYLSDNGFGEYYKPSDLLFDSVAAGRMLILSPHSYDAGKRRITRNECVQLNNMAEEIADE
ncbi:hypothetical protein J6Y50_01365 [bacterium]|nr:hypothetical protein [bacterium]